MVDRGASPRKLATGLQPSCHDAACDTDNDENCGALSR